MSEITDIKLAPIRTARRHRRGRLISRGSLIPLGASGRGQVLLRHRSHHLIPTCPSCLSATPVLLRANAVRRERTFTDRYGRRECLGWRHDEAGVAKNGGPLALRNFAVETSSFGARSQRRRLWEAAAENCARDSPGCPEVLTATQTTSRSEAEPGCDIAPTSVLKVNDRTRCAEAKGVTALKPGEWRSYLRIL